MPRTILYVAYPMRLDLSAANAIQTYSTVEALTKILPGVRPVVPRWLREPSAFTALGALHLPRPALNKLSRFLPWGGWSYLERTLFSVMLVSLMMVWRVIGHRYPVIYARDVVCAAVLGLAHPLHGSRVIYEVHDLEALHPTRVSRWPAFFWRWLLPWLDGQAIRRAWRVVSLTGSFRSWLVERGERRGDDIAVIPDGFDPAAHTAIAPGEARGQLGIHSGDFVVGYTGLTFAYRGVGLLVEAFEKFAAGKPDARLVLVGGSATEVEQIREYAGRLGIEAAVVLPGKMPHAAAVRYLYACDVLVLPDTVTQLTASPLKLFEYMAAGKAIVLKDMPALREIVDEECAMFFPEGDVAALAAALEALYRDRDLTARLGAAARTRSVQYTYHARATAILEVARPCL